MDTTLILWLVGGGVAVLAMMLIVVAIARSLDRDKTAEKAAVARLAGLTSKIKGSPGLAAAAGPVAALLAHAHADSKSGDEKPVDAKTKQIRATIAGLAIGGGVLMAIVGILTGDN